MDNSYESEDVSSVIDNIVRRALQISKNLFCPYCAEEYMFEFTLRDHLKRKHEDLLQADKGKDNLGNYLCPFCDAVFYLFGLLPKHINNSHGNHYLQNWQQNEENIQQIKQQKEREPSITYAICSPGLSDVFEPYEGQKTFGSCENDHLKIKSILKKPTCKVNKFIHSPSSVSIRRSKNEIIRRSSVRRELRFDLPSIEKSSQEKVKTNPKRFLGLRLFFKRKKFLRRKKTTNQLFTNIITSTPINFLHNSDNLDSENSCQRDNSSYDSHNNLPLAFSFEMYQCAKCKEKYSSNRDLLLHLKCEHKKIWYVLRPQYQCGQCGRKYFSNKTLLSHCYSHNISY